MNNLASSVYLFLARSAAVILQLRFVEHWFGPRHSGLNVLLNQVTYYILLAEFGLAAAALSLLFEPVERAQHGRAAALLAALRHDLFRLILLAAPIAAAALALYALRLRQQLPYGEALGALLLSAASSFITLATLPQQAYLNARNRIFEVNLTLGSGFLLKTVLGLGLARLTGSYLALAGTYPAVALLEATVLRLRCRGLLPSAAPAEVAEAGRELRAKSKYVLLHRIGGLVYYQSDYIILSLGASLATVGAYAEYQYLAAGFVGLFTACTNAVTARLARAQLAINPTERQGLYAVTSRAALFAAAACAVFYAATARDWVALLFRVPSHAGALPALLAALLFLNLAKSGDDVWVNARGSFEIGFTFPLFEAALYIALGFVLVRAYGVVGIVLAGIATNLVFSGGLRSIIIARGVLQTTAAKVLRLRAGALGIALGCACPLLLLLARPGGPLGSPAGHAGAALLLAAPFAAAVLSRLSKTGRAMTAVSRESVLEGVR